ncbi:cytochrome P450 [Nocardiopsis sp. JB363]|uniref:cytochrome P450 n=1 Tax=Nocardiopsis sp. JB363 TaxID=1434837 RepID=UPI00097A8C59|nr:cytochrome P450 [Nocardiopsis sp. JB363]SIO90365.1 putative cytochrome P450 hydroxylase [Nocardiopsis sp. JB363]
MFDGHDLTDPRFWTRGDTHRIVARMRDEAPVHRHEGTTEGDIWGVFTHEHAVEVLGNAEVYGSEGGSLLGSGNPPAGAGRMMALTDPPRHRGIRNAAADRFSPRSLARFEPAIRKLVAELIDLALGEEEFDFVGSIASVVPMVVLCDVMDIPAKDRSSIERLCDEAFLSGAPNRRREAHQDLLAYLLELVIERRIDPGDDLVSALASGEGRYALSIQDAVLNCDNIMVGGVQTVRHTASAIMHLLLHAPGLWNRLRSPDLRFNPAVDELLRVTSVGVHVLRTVRKPAELGGRHLSTGDRVVVWIPSANRDPEVFQDPDRADLTRTPNRHLALGRGPHFCVGAALARLELRLLLEELVGRVGAIESTGPATPALSIINLGLNRLPMRFHTNTGEGVDA